MSSAILTIILLLIAFYLKMTINKEFSLPNFLAAIAELPVDIMFTSTTFIISFRFINSSKIIQEKNYNEMDLYTDFVYFAAYIFITAIVITIWRTSMKNMDKGKWGWFSFSVFISYLLSVLTLIAALAKMNGVV